MNKKSNKGKKAYLKIKMLMFLIILYFKAALFVIIQIKLTFYGLILKFKIYKLLPLLFVRCLLRGFVINFIAKLLN